MDFLAKSVGFVVILTACLWVGFSFAFMWPPLMQEDRYYHHMRTCMNNLRQIDAAKDQWATETGQSTGTPVIKSEVNEYIKGNRTCPDGGRYTYNVVSTDPTCSYVPQEPETERKVRMSIFTYRIDKPGVVPVPHAIP